MIKGLLLISLVSFSTLANAADVDGMHKLLKSLSTLEGGILLRLDNSNQDQVDENAKALADALASCDANHIEKEADVTSDIKGANCPLSYASKTTSRPENTTVITDGTTNLELIGDALKSLTVIRSIHDQFKYKFTATDDQNYSVQFFSEATAEVDGLGTGKVTRGIFQKLTNGALSQLNVMATVEFAELKGAASVIQSANSAICTLDGQSADCKVVMTALGY